jgi:putative AbiEi antitoxin of type IV toxin-antitoxin system
MLQREEHALPDLFTGGQAQALGWTRHQVEWAVKSGRWRALRRGIYTVDARYEELEVVERHLLHCRAAVRTHDQRHVLSHLSAAVSFGLPSPIGGPGRPTLTIGLTGASTDRQDDLVVQVASLRERDSIPWDEGRRTTPARTVADCLRHVPTPEAVAIADMAVRRGLTDLAGIQDVLQWQGGWPYAQHGHDALELIDPRRESWLESFSFVTLHRFGIPLPVPQVVIRDSRGRFVGRVDGYWPDHVTVGEADGRLKYGIAEHVQERSGGEAEAGELARRAVLREKEREDRLRDTGVELVRWTTWDIVHQPSAVAERLQRAFRRADPGRFTGVALAALTPAGLAVETGFAGLPQGA